MKEKVFESANGSEAYFFDDGEPEEDDTINEEVINCMCGPSPQSEEEEDDDELTPNESNEQDQISCMLWVVNHNNEKVKPKKDDGRI